MIFYGQKKTKMRIESPMNFFMEDLRMLKSSNAESFSLVGDGHRIGGRFLVELPCYCCNRDLGHCGGKHN